MPGCFAKRHMPFMDHVGLLHKVEERRTAYVCRKTDNARFSPERPNFLIPSGNERLYTHWQCPPA